jgi:hypothetical protein
MSAREIRAQPFPSLELMSVDERASIAAPSSRKPGQRTFGFIVNNCGAAKFSDQLALLQHKMLGTKMIDDSCCCGAGICGSRFERRRLCRLRYGSLATSYVGLYTYTVAERKSRGCRFILR